MVFGSDLPLKMKELELFRFSWKIYEIFYMKKSVQPIFFKRPKYILQVVQIFKNSHRKSIFTNILTVPNLRKIQNFMFLLVMEWPKGVCELGAL